MINNVLEYRVGHADLLGETIAGDGELINLMDEAVGAPGAYLYTIVADGLVIALAGLWVRWAGMADVWTFPSCRVRKYPKLYYTTIKWLIRTHQEKLGLHRIQTPIRVDWEMNQRWIEKLGFKWEARLQKFGVNKEDYYMYARLY